MKVRLNIRNLYRNKSLYQHGMLPRIRYLTGDKASLGWHIDPVITSEVRFYPTIQNFCFDSQFFNKDRQYCTLSFNF